MLWESFLKAREKMSCASRLNKIKTHLKEIKSCSKQIKMLLFELLFYLLIFTDLSHCMNEIERMTDYLGWSTFRCRFMEVCIDFIWKTQNISFSFRTVARIRNLPNTCLHSVQSFYPNNIAELLWYGKNIVLFAPLLNIRRCIVCTPVGWLLSFQPIIWSWSVIVVLSNVFVSLWLSIVCSLGVSVITTVSGLFSFLSHSIMIVYMVKMIRPCTNINNHCSLHYFTTK